MLEKVHSEELLGMNETDYDIAPNKGIDSFSVMASVISYGDAV